jgi:hypothetical protein
MTFPVFAAGEILRAQDMNAVGMWKVADNTFTAISAGSPLNIDGCFTSDYNNYRIELEWLQNTAQGEMNIRLRDAGGTIITNYGFSVGGYFFNSGTGTFAGINASANETQTSGTILSCTTGTRGSVWYDVFGPNQNRETNFVGQVQVSTATATVTRVSAQTSIRHTAATVCTGLQLYTSAGTATGTIRIYGYRN